MSGVLLWQITACAELTAIPANTKKSKTARAVSFQRVKYFGASASFTNAVPRKNMHIAENVPIFPVLSLKNGRPVKTPNGLII